MVHAATPLKCFQDSLVPSLGGSPQESPRTTPPLDTTLSTSTPSILDNGLTGGSTSPMGSETTGNAIVMEDPAPTRNAVPTGVPAPTGSQFQQVIQPPLDHTHLQATVLLGATLQVNYKKHYKLRTTRNCITLYCCIFWHWTRQ